MYAEVNSDTVNMFTSAYIHISLLHFLYIRIVYTKILFSAYYLKPLIVSVFIPNTFPVHLLWH